MLYLQFVVLFHNDGDIKMIYKKANTYMMITLSINIKLIIHY